MFHKDRQIISLPIWFLKLVRWAVADWRIAKDGARTLLNKLVEFILLFHKIEPEARLLVPALFQLCEIDAKVELLELVLTTELNTVKGPWIVTTLILNRSIILPTQVMALNYFIWGRFKNF